MWRDKSGRGYSNNKLTETDLLQWENEEDWNGNLLHEFAHDAEEGDKWENAANEIICITNLKTLLT